MLERAAGRLRAQATRAGLSLRVDCAPDIPLANADAERVEQVLVNLLHNAIKFTNPGGHVTLRAAPQSPSENPKSTIGNAQMAPESAIVISVSDTGVGIPPDDLDRIFERFYKVDKSRTGTRDRESGTGLGLAIAKHIIQAHGGQIWAESSTGLGTTFFFTLPCGEERDDAGGR
jgi:two-component system phosphate regulon sensor histidine kinase PhoR